MGGGTGKDAVNHRLRPIKALAQMMSEYVAQNKDPGDLRAPEGKGSDRATPRKKGEEKGGGDPSPTTFFRLLTPFPFTYRSPVVLTSHIPQSHRYLAVDLKSYLLIYTWIFLN